MLQPDLSSPEHEPCVSEVSSTISRLRLHSSQNSKEQNDDKESCCSTLVSEAASERNLECELRPFTIQRSGIDNACFQIPIIGYEVMEERARFTVYKLRIDNKNYGDCWFVFRRYTDFVRLHSKLKRDFPSTVLTLPRKRWFGDNFNSSFLEERIQGLQSLINSILDNPHMRASQSVREFFCLDEPPSYADTVEESRPIFDALEETIYHLRCQLRDKEWELRQMQKKMDSFSQLKNSSKLCAQCKPEVQKCLFISEQDLTASVKSSGPLV
ncbi:sorting nexin-16 [Thrips palmi]|uniref:Sorting nexin-16 n=1 Tax=Thrips palmi TaxID=161013 RepID=A0A6P8Y607_THRPL|nr:sorting nexin-16 [Thrips palmi]XP_034231955.1 sorting nexin-16 [Thrips palmi]XP_034231956.1 sorting nexin-16 [Thrips palmi]XP_034231957.1 sorting nexin-16 [Thrips palmi]